MGSSVVTQSVCSKHCFILRSENLNPLCFMLFAIYMTSCHATPQDDGLKNSQRSFDVSGLNLDIDWKEGTIYILPRDIVEGRYHPVMSRLSRRSPNWWNGGWNGGYYNGGYNRPYYNGGGGYGGYRYNNGRLLEEALVVGGAAFVGAEIGNIFG